MIDHVDHIVLTTRDLDACVRFYEALGMKLEKIIEGPVAKTGAVSKLRSVYVRDPDLNLIEISEPV